jgi:transposase
MKAKRKRHDAEFKARVAIEAIRGVKTIQQIAKEYEVHPVQVSDWKKTMTAGASSVFGPNTGNSEAEIFERERSQLHAKIGQLTIELDWLSKKSKQLGL